MTGEVIDVYVISRNTYDVEVYGVFPTLAQANWYFFYEQSLHEQMSRIIKTLRGFRPKGEDRVFLIREQPYALETDYIPEVEKAKLVLRKQAWDKLTEEEREVLGLIAPKEFPDT